MDAVATAVYHPSRSNGVEAIRQIGFTLTPCGREEVGNKCAYSVR